MPELFEFLLSALEDLSSSLSHEFRTPVARLKFAFAMLEDNTLEINAPDYLCDMHMAFHELVSFVSVMLENARL
ncbi:two-component sensor histidine kinase, partial [Pseudoalteromonas sp. S1609]|uniref:histidine kinase dimerization/phospho-acceptor domain-containing protein n=1 Tax=Pseudoalteromonas sp. S1609 TaxID=579505 RepID=UPI00128063EA